MERLCALVPRPRVVRSGEEAVAATWSPWAGLDWCLGWQQAAPSPVFSAHEAPRIPPQTPAYVDAALRQIGEFLARPGAPVPGPTRSEAELCRIERARAIVLPVGYRRLLLEVGDAPPPSRERRWPLNTLAAALAEAEHPERPFPLTRTLPARPDPRHPERQQPLPPGTDPLDGTIELAFDGEQRLLVVTGDRAGQVWQIDAGGDMWPVTRYDEALDALSWLLWQLESLDRSMHGR